MAAAVNPTSVTLAKRALGYLRHPLFLRLKAALLSWHFRRLHTGRGSYVDRSTHVLGWRSVRIGSYSVVSADCWLNVNHRTASEPRLVIGDHCHIGRRNLLSSARLLRLGDYCLTGPDCRFVGSDHVIDDPFLPYVSTGATDHGVIDVGANCWLGAGVTVVGNVSIGHGSVIGALTLVNKDVPPFSLVVGNPGRVIKRYDARLKTWVSQHLFSTEAEQALPDEQAYLAILRRARPEVPMPLAAASKRMGDSP
jgi:acetyltransferase-like isoleucine patch superfamily enzyme